MLLKESRFSHQMRGEMGKLFTVYTGSYVIVERLGEATYRIAPSKIQGMFHIISLKKYYRDPEVEPS